MKHVPPRLHIDFVVRRRWPGALGWGALALGLALSVWVLWDYARIQDDTALVHAQADRTSRQIELAHRLAERERADPGLQQDLGSVRKVAVALSLDWQPLFAELEQRRRDDIALLSLEPDASRQALRLTGEAKDLKALFDWLESFSDARVLGAPRVEAFEYRQRGSVQVLAFSVRMRWSGS